MKTIVSANYEEMSKKAASLIIEYVNRKPDALICLAAGNTPLGTFACLREAAGQGAVSFESCKFVSLDEWVGLDGSAEGSCRQTLYDHFFAPLAIREDQIQFFDGMSSDLQGECDKMDAFISSHGKVDLFLLGVGMNGHLGFNEPGVSFDLLSHVIDLDAVTKTVSVKYFDEQKDLKQGITIGIGHMMKAETVIVIADGSKKADIIAKSFQGEVKNEVPASALQRHPNVFLCLDESAARLMN